MHGGEEEDEEGESKGRRDISHALLTLIHARTRGWGAT